MWNNTAVRSLQIALLKLLRKPESTTCCVSLLRNQLLRKYKPTHNPTQPNFMRDTPDVRTLRPSFGN